MSFLLFGRGVRFALTTALLGRHIFHVVSLRTQKQMARVNARGIVALMKNMQSVKDRAIVQFPTKVTCKPSLVTNAKTGAPFSAATRPFPTIIKAALVYLLPETFSIVFLGIMAVNKTHRLAFNSILRSIRFNGNCCQLTATTVAITVWDFLRGMIHDVTRSFRRLTMPRDTCNVAVALLLVVLIIPKGALS